MSTSEADGRIAQLRAQVQELQAVLEAIRSGDVDAVVVGKGAASQVFSITELRRENAALEEAQAAAHMGSWEWDPVTDQATMSKEAKRILGPSATSLRQFRTVVHPQDAGKLKEFVDALMAAGPDESVSAEVRLATPPHVHLRIRGRVTARDRQGRPSRLAGTTEDVTEDVRRLQAEQRSRILLEQAQRLAQMGAWEWDQARGTMTWTSEMYRIHEVARDFTPYVFRQGMPFFSPEDGRRLAQAFDAACAGGARFDLDARFVSATGREKWLRVVGQPHFEAGQVARVFGHLRDITDQVRAQQALRESEESHRRMVEESPLGIVRVAPDGRFLEANPAAARIYGLGSREDLLRANAKDFDFDPSERAVRLQEVQRGKQDGLARLRRADGQAIWIRSVSRAVRGTDGEVLYYQGLFEDVTATLQAEQERAEAQQQRRVTEARLAAIVASSHDAIYSKGLDGVIQTWNASAARIYGWSEAEAVGRKVADLVLVPGSQDEADLITTLAAGTPFHRALATRRRKDGALIDVRLTAHPVRDAAGEIVAISVASQDVTERRKAKERQQALQQETRKMLQILDHVQALTKAGAWEYDPATDKVTWSRELYRLHEVDEGFDLSHAENVLRFYDGPDRDRMLAAQKRMQEDGVPYDLELAMTTARGTRKAVRALAVPEMEGGKVVRILGYVADVTEQKRAEAAKAELEQKSREVARLEELSRLRMEFLNAAAHDLNTPLTPVRLALATLDRGKLEASERETLEIIDRNVKRFQVLVQDMLDSARLQSGRLKLKRSRTPLAPLVEEAVASFQEPARQAGLKLVLLPVPAMDLDIDKVRMSQVLFNLVSNAVKYTRHGQVHVVVTLDDHAAVIAVQDTGVGFTPAQAGRLFQPFTRLHEEAGLSKGTGLGLYISKGIVEQHGGRIYADSPGPGKGATFSVWLPRVQVTAEDAPGN